MEGLAEYFIKLIRNQIFVDFSAPKFGIYYSGKEYLTNNLIKKSKNIQTLQNYMLYNI